MCSFKRRNRGLRRNRLIINICGRKITIDSNLWDEVIKRTPSYDEESLAIEVASKLGRKKSENVQEVLRRFSDKEVSDACNAVLLSRKKLWEQHPFIEKGIFMKTFKVDNFNISIDDDLYQKALDYYVLEKEDSEEEKRGNYLYLKNAIRAGSCNSLDELKAFSYENLRKVKTDEEISAIVKKIIIRSLRDYGCNL